MNAQTERLSLFGAAGTIEAVRDAAHVPEGAVPRGVAVIAHPHPLFGGTMDNKVVQTLARAFVQCGWTAVRFNFRGVGASAGAHDEGRGEAQDFLRVVEQVAPQGPIALAGFSFGSFVASHALADLWDARTVEHAVLVGTATSRFNVPRCRRRPTCAPWSSTASTTTPCPCPPCSTGRGPRCCPSPSCPAAVISFTDN